MDSIITIIIFISCLAAVIYLFYALYFSNKSVVKSKVKTKDNQISTIVQSNISQNLVMGNVTVTSLRESIISIIGNFLYDEGFANDEITKYGILEIVNLISDYHEEGNALFPEILVTNSLDFFKTIPNKELIIQEAELSIPEFKNAIKLCAPLATNSWIIFIEVKGKRIKYGITSAEMVETSPSIYNQTVGDLKVEYKDTTIAYIRNIGQKAVELSGLKKRVIVSLTLDEPKQLSLNEVQTLAKSISSDCEEKYKVNIQTFFEKTIDEALKDGHGNLIGIVKDEPKATEKIKKEMKSKGGIYLPSPIDFEYIIKEAEINRTNEASINLKSYSSVFKAMLNHDGITIITTRGKVIGYHILIGDYSKASDVVNGGARSMALKSMENCDFFQLCFYKSQDGNIKLWQKK